MVTVVRIELTDDQRRSLGLRLTGYNRLASREQVDAHVRSLLQRDLTHPDEPVPTSGLRNVVCPKCRKPIAVRL